jgi:hypothetical protein
MSKKGSWLFRKVFVEILGKHKIPVFDYPIEEQKKD